MPVQGGDAVGVADGFGSRESDDGKWLYFSRPSDSPEKKTAIFKVPIGVGAETLVFNGVTNEFWSLASQSLYFMNVDAKLHATNRFDLSNRKITRIADVEKEPFTWQSSIRKLMSRFPASCWWKISIGSKEQKWNGFILQPCPCFALVVGLSG